MAKINLARFLERRPVEAKKEATTPIARVWTGEPVPEGKGKAPLFLDFAAT